MTGRQLGAATGIVMLGFVVLAVGAFSALAAMFEYPDILREPTETILRRFAEGGASLVLMWFVFTLSALGFVFVALLFGRWASERLGTDLRIATAFGISSGLLQAVGLVRWVFVIPPLATAYADPAASDVRRETIAALFSVIHQYGGVAIGESLGQITLVLWTLGVAVALLKTRGAWKVLGIVPLATVPLWLLAQTELLHTAVPGFPVFDTAPFAFIVWEIWLLGLAVTLIFGGPQAVPTATPSRAS